MKKRMYFHSSNLDYRKYLKDEEKFDPVYHYPKQEMDLAHPNEFGKIRTLDFNYHILLGHLRNEDCPWCGCSDVHLKKEEEKIYQTRNLFAKDKYWMQCNRCGSRGPIIFVDEKVSIDNSFKEHLLLLIKDRYSQRLAWDSKLEKGNTE